MSGLANSSGDRRDIPVPILTLILKNHFFVLDSNADLWYLSPKAITEISGGQYR